MPRVSGVVAVPAVRPGRVRLFLPPTSLSGRDGREEGLLGAGLGVLKTPYLLRPTVSGVEPSDKTLPDLLKPSVVPVPRTPVY